MRFEVLGPVTVRTDDGEAVAVPEAKVRALLADLLVHEGRPVPVDTLIDDLWGDAVPGNPANSLQTKVSQLRRALAKAEPGARALVAYGPAGYALRVAPDAVDAGRFTRLTARARQETDPAAKAELLTRALELWRASAYADFRDAGFARAAIARLEEQRLTVREELAEVRLALGEHTALADELAALVALHPLRQRLWATLMRALYRSGRQSEALAAYAGLRERFAEELGIDPGPELASLHTAILRQDPALAGAPAPPGTATAPVGPSPAAPAPASPTTPTTPAAEAPSPTPSPIPSPAPAPPSRPRTNLPAPVSALVGRQDATARVRALVEANRLVTLTGPGGVGKTRLALAAAARLAEEPAAARFPDGVWFVELAGSGGEVAETVAAALGLRDDDVHQDADVRAAAARNGTADVLSGVVAEALAARRMLLVLDNCEHLVGPLAAFVGLLLRRAPGVRVLATSQEPLALSGEVLEAVAPLAGAEAMELFAARAAACAPGFALEPGNTEAVALICRRLDGIPLALELAATRVRVLGVHALADRLHDRFRLLDQVRRDAPARQRTLRATIDWSWDLLAPPERTLMRRLAVFTGGFTLESAEAVCAGGGIAADDVLDLLTRLVDRSLVVAAHPPARYRILESVLAYGRERLDEAGEAAALRQRHARHFTELAEHAAPLLHGGDQRRWLHVLDTEAPNLRAALEHAGPDGLRLVNSLAWYWHVRGRVGEALRSLDQALDQALGQALGQARADGGDRAHRIRPAYASARIRRAAFALLTGVEVAPDDDFAGADARGRWLLAYGRCGFGGPVDRPEEESDLDALGAEFRALGDRWGEAATLAVRASRALYQGDLAALRQYAEAGAALFGELGDRWGSLQAAEQLGVLAEIGGDYEAAARLHRDGVRDAQELRLWTSASFGLARLGRIALLTGDDAGATDYHEQARRLAVEQSHRPAQQFAETGLALGARRRGDLATARALLEPWLEWNRRLGVDSGTALILAQLGYAAEQAGDARRAEALHREGLAAARRTGDRRALALALEGLAGAHAAADRPVRAATLLGTAAALRASVGTPLPPAERVDVDRAAARARAVLGEAEFTATFTRGRELSPDEADATCAAGPAGPADPADAVAAGPRGARAGV
ncbi:AfsR/SARP family transcriptional regulator [Streptomyces sp. NPDC090022]|uniref:AfsR/SARP family transcriptional regulator n=1 Tax=Streptomyces sp. NPDC090022 TaxID=3365920 RepID=UPI0038126BBF